MSVIHDDLLRSVLFLSHSIDLLAHMIDPLIPFHQPQNVFPPVSRPVRCSYPTLAFSASPRVVGRSRAFALSAFRWLSDNFRLSDSCLSDTFPYPTFWLSDAHLSCLSARRPLSARRAVGFPTLAYPTFWLSDSGYPTLINLPPSRRRLSARFPSTLLSDVCLSDTQQVINFQKLINHSINACSQQFSGSPGKYGRPRLTIPFLH